MMVESTKVQCSRSMSTRAWQRKRANSLGRSISVGLDRAAASACSAVPDLARGTPPARNLHTIHTSRRQSWLPSLRLGWLWVTSAERRQPDAARRRAEVEPDEAHPHEAEPDRVVARWDGLRFLKS